MASEWSNIQTQIRKRFDENSPIYKFLDYLFSEETLPGNFLYDTAFEKFVNAIPDAIKGCPNAQIRTQCSTVFSRFLGKNWSLVHPDSRYKVKAFFFQLLCDEKDWEAMKVHVTAVLSVFEPHSWPELNDWMLQRITSQGSDLSKRASIFMLGELIPKHPAFYIRHIKDIYLGFKSIMEYDGDYRIITSTLCSSVNLMVFFPSELSKEQFTGLSLGFIRVLEDAHIDQDLACHALDAMLSLAKSKEFKKILEPIMQWTLADAIITLATDPSLRENTRRLAIEFFVKVAESGDEGYKMIYKLNSNILERLLKSLRMQMSVEDKIADSDDYDTYCYSEKAFGRLAISLGGETIVRVCLEMLSYSYVDENWKTRHAVVSPLRLIASGCSRILAQHQHLEQYVDKILVLAHDDHPRVRCVSIHTIGEFSKYLNPKFQIQFHEKVIPVLSDALDDFGNPGVQSHAALALGNFSRNWKILSEMQLDVIIRKLLVLLEIGNTVCQGAALNALASLADSSKVEFQPFYDTIMPYLKVILRSVKANSNSDCILLAKTLVCITVFAVAVGNSVSGTDVIQVVDGILLVQEYCRHSNTDEEITCYLLQAWGRLCTSLGHKFDPYLRVSMPLLIENANQKGSTVLKEICATLECFASKTRCLYLWTHEVLEIVLRLLTFDYDQQVRLAAISVMPLVLKSAAFALDNNLCIPNYPKSPIVNLSVTITPALFKILVEPNIKIRAQTLGALRQSLQIPNTWIPNDLSIINSLTSVLLDCFNRKKEREKRVTNSIKYRKPDLLEEDAQDGETVCREIRICLPILVKRLYDQNLKPRVRFVERMFVRDASVEERIFASSIFSDVSKLGLTDYEDLIPPLLSACVPTNLPDIQQITARAIGVCAAKFGGETFKPHLEAVLSCLEGIFQQPSTTEHAMAKESAVCAYGKVCFFHWEDIKSYEKIELWLSHLPLESNSDESKDAHGMLCSMIDMLETKDTGSDESNSGLVCSVIEKPETKITGSGNDGIGGRISIMVKVLLAGENVATLETRRKIVEYLNMLKQKLGRDFDEVYAKLDADIKKPLRTYSSLL